MAYNLTNHHAYVSNYGSDLVKVFDADTMQFERALTNNFASPAHIAADPTTNKTRQASSKRPKGGG